MTNIDRVALLLFIAATLGWLWLTSEALKVALTRLARIQQTLDEFGFRAPPPGCPAHELHSTLPAGEPCPGCGEVIWSDEQ